MNDRRKNKSLAHNYMLTITLYDDQQLNFKLNTAIPRRRWQTNKPPHEHSCIVYANKDIGNDEEE